MPKSPLPNPVMLFRPEAYRVGDRVEGRQAAGESYLKGLVRHGGYEEFFVASPSVKESKAFLALVEKWLDEVSAKPETGTKVTHVPYAAIHKARQTGLVWRPDPLIGEFAWWRRRTDPYGFSICGVAHTTASDRVVNGLVDLMRGPTEAWDAIICPSRAVNAMIREVLDTESAYLKERFGGKPVCPIELPVIPLGVNEDLFTPSPERKAAGQKLRQRLGIGDDDVAALFVGRLAAKRKLNPGPTCLALQQAAEAIDAKLHMIWCGWFRDDKDKNAFLNTARQVAPDVVFHYVDGQKANVREYIWHAADLFVALVDNIQETFGLVPVEAMAAGLPVVATDWDGFRDTVEDGVTGMTVATAMPPPGSGRRTAWRYECFYLDFDEYLHAITQTVWMDIAAAGRAIAKLASDATLRAKMGEEGRKRVASHYDWRNIIPQYQDLWRELEARRLKAEAADTARKPKQQGGRALDPYRMFASYPSSLWQEDDRRVLGQPPSVPKDVTAFSPRLGMPTKEPDFSAGTKGETLGSLLPSDSTTEGGSITDTGWITLARHLRWRDTGEPPTRSPKPKRRLPSALRASGPRKRPKRRISVKSLGR